MKQLRIGLIGAGRIGAVHANSISALSETVLQCVCDPLVGSAKRIAAAHGGRVTTDPAAVIGASDVDAVIIASPTPTHIELLSRAIDADLPALCEKPIDLDIARVEDFRGRAASTRAPIMLGFNHRFDPHFADLRQRVAAGQIGRLEQLAIISRDSEPPPRTFLETSGGIFHDLTIHDFDTARCFIPAITEITARGANQFSAEIQEIGDYDAASIIMAGGGGEQITITNSRHAAYGYDQRIEAFGSEGLLTIGNISDSCVRRWSGTAVEALQPYQHFFPERYANAFRLELAEFVKAVRGEPHECPGLEDGRAALLLADAAERSARTGSTVSVNLTA